VSDTGRKSALQIYIGLGNPISLGLQYTSGGKVTSRVALQDTTCSSDASGELKIQGTGDDSRSYAVTLLKETQIHIPVGLGPR